MFIKLVRNVADGSAEPRGGAVGGVRVGAGGARQGPPLHQAVPGPQAAGPPQPGTKPPTDSSAPGRPPRFLFFLSFFFSVEENIFLFIYLFTLILILGNRK